MKTPFPFIKEINLNFQIENEEQYVILESLMAHVFDVFKCNGFSIHDEPNSDHCVINQPEQRKKGKSTMAKAKAKKAAPKKAAKKTAKK